MNASLIHTSALECWKRARELRVSSSGFLCLQALYTHANASAVFISTLVEDTGMDLGAVIHLIHRLSYLGLVTICAPQKNGKTGRPPVMLRLTLKATQLLTPMALLSEAESAAPTSNPWRNSQL